MPYKNTRELPEQVKANLPPHAQKIFLEAFNHAWDEYSDPKKRRGKESQEQTAFKVAWAAVKKEYKKKPGTDEWVAKGESGKKKTSRTRH